MISRTESCDTFLLVCHICTTMSMPVSCLERSVEFFLVLKCALRYHSSSYLYIRALLFRLFHVNLHRLHTTNSVSEQPAKYTAEFSLERTFSAETYPSWRVDFAAYNGRFEAKTYLVEFIILTKECFVSKNPRYGLDFAY